MKGTKEKRKWYFLIAIALIVGAMIGYFTTNTLSTTGDAITNLKNTTTTKYTNEIKETIRECCDSNPADGVWAPHVKENCCLMIQMGLDETIEFADGDGSNCCKRNSDYNAECCNARQRDLFTLIKK